MKTFLASMVALAVILGASITYIIVLDNTVSVMEEHVDEMLSAVENEDWEICEASLSHFFEHYEKTHPLLCSVIDHSELDEINRSMYGIKGYVAFRDREKAATELGILKILIQKIPENEMPTLENIL